MNPYLVIMRHMNTTVNSTGKPEGHESNMMTLVGSLYGNRYVHPEGLDEYSPTIHHVESSSHGTRMLRPLLHKSH